MKKLRLIKPWHVRPIRQRLCAAHVSTETPPVRPVTAEGPAGDLTVFDRIRTENIDFHFSHLSPERTACPNNAPVSDVIFAEARS